MGKHKYYFYVSMILLFFFFKKEKNFHLIPYCFTNQNISSACHNNKNNFKVLLALGIWFCHPFIVRYFSLLEKRKTIGSVIYIIRKSPSSFKQQKKIEMNCIFKLVHVFFFETKHFVLFRKLFKWNAIQSELKRLVMCGVDFG